jgi:putative transcriptional regulator
MSIDEATLGAILAGLGQRLRRARLDANLTQAALATRAGVSLKTVRNAEDGQNISVETLVLLLQGVGRQQDLERLLASEGPSPVELAERQGRARQRASGRRARDASATDTWQW